MKAEGDIFGNVCILIGIALSFVVPLVIHLYPRLPLVPSAKKWEQLPDELQVRVIKKVRSLGMLIYFVGGLIFIAIGIGLSKSHFSSGTSIEDTKAKIKYMGEVQEVKAAQGKQVVPTFGWMKKMDTYFKNPPKDQEEREKKQASQK